MGDRLAMSATTSFIPLDKCEARAVLQGKLPVWAGKEGNNVWFGVFVVQGQTNRTQDKDGGCLSKNVVDPNLLIQEENVCIIVSSLPFSVKKFVTHSLKSSLLQRVQCGGDHGSVMASTPNYSNHDIK